MNLFKKMSYSLVLLIGTLTGFIIPLIFIFLDLHELNLPYNFRNIWDIFNSQNVYLFSSVLFPLFSATILTFIKITLDQKIQIEAARDFNNRVLKDLSSMVVILNKKNEIIYYNDSFENFYKNFESKYTTMNEYIRESHFVEVLSDRSSTEIVYELENGDGKKSSFSCAVIDVDGENKVYNLNCLDDIMNYQNIIEQQNQQMVIASRLSALGEMAAGIAHEINNPLAIIKGKCFLLRSDLKKEALTNEAKEKYFEDIYKSIDRASKIISSLRTMARGDHSKEGQQEFKIIDVIEDVKELALVRAQKEVDVKINYNKLENEVIKIRKVEFGQVIINLFNNAFDAIANLPEKWVLLNLASDEKNIYFEIVDSGHGIPKEAVDKIFTPMFTTKEIGKGTGLGLSLSLSIVKSEGGNLYYEPNSPNTKFVVTLPKPTSTQVA